jgi:hypothetical protein
MNDAEWDSLSAIWTASEERVDAAPLRKIVAAHRRRLIAVSAGELATLAALAWLTYVVLRDGARAWEIVWAITLWGFAAIAGAFVWWNRRGTWQALSDSVAEHVRLTRVRAERQRTSLRFGIALFFAEAIAVVAQLMWFDRLTVKTFVLLAASAVIVAVCVIVGQRRIARDLRVVEEYERHS